MKSLKSNIDSRRGKNVDILLISEEVMGNGAIISVSEPQGRVAYKKYPDYEIAFM